MPHFVWTYWAGGAKEDELRWSIRSTLNFFPDAMITVIGDPPDWYTGHKIFRMKIPEVANHNAIDVIEKMWVLANSSEISETFVWMMDDIYFLNQCSIEDLGTPRVVVESESFVNMKFKKWKKFKFNTYEVLRNSGYSFHNYATHLPQVITKTNLRKVFKTFEVRTPYLWEILYGNMFRTSPIDCFPFLHSQNEPVSIADIEKARQTSVILNHGNKRGWSDELRLWLSKQHPNQTKVEK